MSGFETDSINSVQFSNHTHYQHFKGQILSSTELKEVFAGLKLNSLDRNYTHLLTGYTKSESFAQEILSIVRHLKSINPNLIYLCDPVLGDNGECYVPEELINFYKTKLIAQAHIITPNQFEAELLSGIKVNTKADAINCLNELHSRGPKIVVISSTSISEQTNILIGFVSKLNKEENSYERYEIKMPKYDAFFVGTGDLFSSIFLSWLTKSNFEIKQSMEKAIATLQSVLKNTMKYAKTKEGGPTLPENIELRLVQNKKHLENPTVEIFATKLD